MILSPSPKQQFFGNNGRPLDGGLLYTYAAGTNNKIATYQNESGTLNTNPIVLDFRGEANIWLDPSLTYKYVLSPRGDTDPPSNPIWSVDNIRAGVTTADLTQQYLGRILWPRTQDEINAGVTPASYAPEQVVFPERYGAVGDGVTDDTNAIIRACSVLANYGILVFQTGKRYRFEHTQPDPNTGTGTQAGYVFSGKTGIKIFAYGATFITTNANNAVMGLFTFYNSNHCRIFGGHAEGSFTYDTAWTGAYACIMGDSRGCQVDGSINGGYALCSVYNRTLAPTGIDTDEPKDTRVEGIARQTRRSVVYVGVGRAHIMDVVFENVARPFYVEGIAGLFAKVVGRQTDASMNNEKIMFAGTVSCTNQDIVADIDAQVIGDGITLQVNDATAITFKNIKLRGRVVATANFAGVKLANLGSNAGTLIENLDMAELSVEVDATRALYITPNIACTLRNITLPKQLTSTATANVATIDNTIAATFSRVTLPDGFQWRSTQVTANNLFVLSGGTVTDVHIGDGSFDYAGTAGAPVQITTAVGLAVGAVRMMQNKNFFCVGSTNVRPYNIDQSGRGFVFSGTLSDTTDYSGLDTIISTAGSGTITAFNRIVPGQKITIAFNGGTQTLQNGANIKLAGGANFVATSLDTITLVCIDPPSGGPLATSTMYEVGRSVN